MNKFFFVIILAGLTMSCSEGLEVKPNAQVKLLTGENSKTWILSKFTLQIEGESPIDVNEFLESLLALRTM
ncbi:MAG: hypothetical protein HC913_16245 [Microscillaceae bacterium]|nr:hypothetical protein [Microscillaceae bacterium]